MKLLDFKVHHNYRALIVDSNEINIGYCHISEQGDDFDSNGKRITPDVRKHFTSIHFYENMETVYIGTYLSYEEAVFAVNKWIENKNSVVYNNTIGNKK